MQNLKFKINGKMYEREVSDNASCNECSLFINGANCGRADDGKLFPACEVRGLLYWFKEIK